MSKRQSKSVRLGVESLDSRLLPSVTFQENTATNSLTLTAAQNQNNTITVFNNGNGSLRVTADGVVRNFTGIDVVNIDSGNGADTVTYNQGTSTIAADLRRDLTMNVELGSNANGTTDTFRANIFGNIGFLQNGALQARSLGLIIRGDSGRDRIDINANHDTDVRTGSQLFLRLQGREGNDNITVDYDGELDGNLDFSASGQDDNDFIAVNFQLDAGSAGSIDCSDNPDDGGAQVLGNFGDDDLRFAIRLAAGVSADVNAIIDGGFGFGFPDNDLGRHTSNVRTAWLEQDILIQ